MKPIRYSKHLIYKMALRKMSASLVEKVFREADAMYLDKDTGYAIAIKRLKFHNKERDLALTYEEKEEEITFVTIHPLKEGQKENRIKSGRWKRL